MRLSCLHSNTFEFVSFAVADQRDPVDGVLRKSTWLLDLATAVVRSTALPSTVM
jgi:hypothetical protein